MNLTDEQRTALSNWIGQGLTLSQMQERLEADFGLRLTYMDLRFLIDDLGLELPAAGPKFDDPAKDLKGPSKEPGKVSVTLDKVARPDALVSGQVTFSDGVSALWYLDQMGRLALDPKQPGYQPSRKDLETFQTELRTAVENSGML